MMTSLDVSGAGGGADGAGDGGTGGGGEGKGSSGAGGKGGGKGGAGGGNDGETGAKQSGLKPLTPAPPVGCLFQYTVFALTFARQPPACLAWLN